MKLYLEALETVAEREEAEFIRAEITGKTDNEVATIQSRMEDIMVGKHYQLSKHYCRHEDGGACNTEIITVV